MISDFLSEEITYELIFERFIDIAENLAKISQIIGTLFIFLSIFIFL